MDREWFEERVKLEEGVDVSTGRPVVGPTGQVSGLKAYLAHLELEGALSRERAQEAWEAWVDVLRAVPEAPVPFPCPGGGSIILAWDDGPRCLELGLSGEEEEGWGFMDLHTRERWDEAYRPGQVPERVVEFFRSLPQEEGE